MRSAIEACSHSLAPIVRGPERLPIQICLEVSASVPPVRRKNGGPGDSADGFSLGGAPAILFWSVNQPACFLLYRSGVPRPEDSAEHIAELVEAGAKQKARVAPKTLGTQNEIIRFWLPNRCRAIGFQDVQFPAQRMLREIADVGNDVHQPPTS